MTVLLKILTHRKVWFWIIQGNAATDFREFQIDSHYSHSFLVPVKSNTVARDTSLQAFHEVSSITVTWFNCFQFTMYQNAFGHDKGQKSAVSGRRLHWIFCLSFLQFVFPFSPGFLCNLVRKSSQNVEKIARCSTPVMSLAVMVFSVLNVKFLKRMVIVETISLPMETLCTYVCLSLCLYIYMYVVVLSFGPIFEVFFFFSNKKKKVPFHGGSNGLRFLFFANFRILQCFMNSSFFAVIMWVLQIMSGLLWAISQHRTFQSKKSWKLQRDS